MFQVKVYIASFLKKMTSFLNYIMGVLRAFSWITAGLIRGVIKEQWLFITYINNLLTILITPPKTNMEHENHPFEKGKSSEPNLHDFGFQPLVFVGANATMPPPPPYH